MAKLLKQHEKLLFTAKSRAAVRLAKDLRKKYPKTAERSDLAKLLKQHEKLGQLREKLNALVVVISIFCILIFLNYLLSIYLNYYY